MPPNPGSDKRDIQPYWGYEDIGIFLLLVAFTAASLHLAVRSHLLSQLWLERSTEAFQIGVVLFLSFSLYLLLKLRYHRPVLKPLGWIWPSTCFLMLAPILGCLLALAVTVFLRLQHQVTPTVPVADFFLLGLVLGPVLEESLFRGCILPVIERSAGKLVAVVVTALLFAVFHGPVNAAHWFWLTATGIAYGWMRIASRTTSAAAFMHASYNLALMVFASS